MEIIVLSMVSMNTDYSRWGNAGQPQLIERQADGGGIIADGETRANRNHSGAGKDRQIIIADGETRANRNAVITKSGCEPIIADGETRANRNATRAKENLIEL